MNILCRLDEDPCDLARLACVCTRFCNVIKTVCWKFRCEKTLPLLVAELVQSPTPSLQLCCEPPGGWGSLQKLIVCCPGLWHAGALLENWDFGLDRELGWFDDLGCPDGVTSEEGELGNSNTRGAFGEESCGWYERNGETKSLPSVGCAPHGSDDIGNACCEEDALGAHDHDDVGKEDAIAAHNHGYGEGIDGHECNKEGKIALHSHFHITKHDCIKEVTIVVHKGFHGSSVMGHECIPGGAVEPTDHCHGSEVLGTECLKEGAMVAADSGTEQIDELNYLQSQPTLANSDAPNPVNLFIDSGQQQESSSDLVDTSANKNQRLPTGVTAGEKRKREQLQKVGKPQRKRHSVHSHVASGSWNLSREQGNKLLANRFRADSLYICDWPGCIHPGDKRKYKLFRGIFKNFKNSHVWRNLKDMQAKATNVGCAFCVCKSTYDMVTTFCLKRPIEYHDDGEPVVRAYVCENGHVAGAWTDRPMYNL